MKKSILLLSGYDAASHRYWRELLEEHLPEYDWTQLALPDRHFAWRVRGNSLGFAFNYQEVLERDYDLLIVTSMVDLSSLRGFCPRLATIPTIVYFHENQFAYPEAQDKHNLVNIQITSIYTALCADKILFNSQYNQRTFLRGCADLLKRLPDQVPKGLVEKIEGISSIAPVPLRTDVTSRKCKQRSENIVPEIVWNHRWEYDKQPEVFFGALRKLKDSGVEFKLHVLGQSFRRIPECFTEAKDLFEMEIINYGYLDREDYLTILEQADYVISSSLHDFQGLSIQEAIYLGCTPIAPNRVAYPEYIDDAYLYTPGDNQEQEIINLFEQLNLNLSNLQPYKHALKAYHVKKLIPQYSRYFEKSMSKTVFESDG